MLFILVRATFDHSQREKGKIPDIVSAGLNTVAIRSPRHPMFRDVLDLIDFPLAAQVPIEVIVLAPPH